MSGEWVTWSPEQVVTHRNWAFFWPGQCYPAWKLSVLEHISGWWLGQAKARKAAWCRHWPGLTALSLPLSSRSLQWENSSISSPQASHSRGPF